MEYRVRVNWLGGAVVLALAVVASIITSAAMAARAYEARGTQASKRAQEITVKGTARSRIASDTAVWSVEVRGEAKTLADAFAALERGAARVHDFLTQRSFRPGEIAPGPIETSTFYVRDDKGQNTREISGYALERRFTITTPDVAKVSAAAGEVTQLLREGVVVTSGSPAYTYSRAADLKVQILGDAAQDARTRADEIAAKAGCRVTDVRQASQGVIQITAPNSTDVSSYGTYDTSTIDKDVSVVVTLTFGIDS